MEGVDEEDIMDEEMDDAMHQMDMDDYDEEVKRQDQQDELDFNVCL